MTSSMGWGSVVRLATGKKEGDVMATERVNEAVSAYNNFYQGGNDDRLSLDKRRSGYTTMINTFYDLVTDFYEYGWGPSFHFAPRAPKELFEASIARQEYFMAQQLDLKKGESVIDLGCGIGGPMRNIARFSGASVLGVNQNEYQIQRCNELCAEQGFTPEQALAIKSDFMTLDNIVDESIDKAFSFEATCHAPDRIKCFSTVFRVLKPGALFAVQEWCLTDLFEKGNKEHEAVKYGIELGNSLPSLTHYNVVLDAMRKAGFEIVVSTDLALDTKLNQMSWFSSLQGSLTDFKQLPHTKVGTRCTHSMVWGMEKIGLAPKGSTSTHAVLLEARDNLLKGGELGIMTPLFFVVARKPGLDRQEA